MKRRARFGSLAGALGALGALCLVLLTPGVGSADLVINDGLLPSLVNINLDDASNVSTVTGHTVQTVNGSTIGMSFFTDPSIKLDASNGQAQISANGDSNALSNLTAVFQSGYGALQLDFSVQQVAADSTLTITAYDQFGTAFTSMLAAKMSGDNKYNVAAVISGSDQELITKVTWSLSSGGADNQTVAKQYRVDGVQAIPAAVPEPSALVAALSGLLPLGVLGLRRYLRNPAGGAT